MLMVVSHGWSLRSLIIGAGLVVAGCFYWATPADAAVRTWDGGGATNNWSEAANWSSDTVPGSSDVATFDATSTKNATIDASFAGTVQGIDINTGYTGTITQARTITITTGNYDQAAGTFTGNSSTFSISNSSFVLSGGTFNAPTGTWTILRDFTVSGGTLNGTGATLTFDGCGWDTSFTYAGNFNVDTGVTVSVTQACGPLFTLVSGTTLSATFSNSSSVVVQAGATLTTTGNVAITSINNLGSFTMGAGTYRSFSFSTFDGTTNDLSAATSFQSDGTLTIGSGDTLLLNAAVTTLSIAGNYVNNGTFDLTGRTLNIFGCGGSSQITHTGNFNSDTGATVTISKNCGGVLTVPTGQTLTATFTNDAAVTVQSGATLVSTGNVFFSSINNLGSFTMGAGTYRSYGNSTFDGATNDLSAATSMQVDGTLTIGTGDTLTLNPAVTTVTVGGNYVNNGTFSLTGRTLNIFGCGGSSQITHTGNFNTDTGATVTVTKNCGGVFTVPNGQTLTASFTNDAAVTVQATGALTTTGNVFFSSINNLGSFTMGAGTYRSYGNSTFDGATNDLSAATSMEVSGSLTIATGDTLLLNAAVTTMYIGATYTNNGTFNISGRTLDFYGCGGAAQIVYTGNFNTATGASVNISKACGGTFTVPNGQILTATFSGNPSALVVQAGGTFTSSGNFNLQSITNSGSLTAGAGTMTLSGNGTFSGTTNDLAALTSITISGTLTVGASSTLELGSPTMSVGTNFTNAGAITADSTVPVTINGFFVTSTITDTSGNTLPLSLIINKTTNNDTVFASDLTLAGGITRTVGVVTNPSAARRVRIGGDLAVNGTQNFGGTNLTIELNGTGTQSISGSATNSSHLVINKASGTGQLGGSVTMGASATCLLDQGTFFLNGYSFSCAGGFTAESGSILQLVGSEVTTTPTLHSGSTVIYVGDGDGAADTFVIKNFIYDNLTINPTDSNDAFGPTGDNPLADGLVAYYPFTEGTGTSTTDGSGNGYTGTLTNTEEADWSSDVPSSNFTNNYSLSLDGSNEFVNLGNPSLFPAGANERTVCGWAKTNSIAAGWAWIVGYGTAVSNQAFSLGRNGSTLYGAGFASEINSASYWTTGVWKHSCFLYNGTTAYLYGNGSLLTQGNLSLNTVRNVAYIGRQVNNNEYWNGNIDEVRVYDRVLTVGEIQALAAGDNTTVATLTNLTVNGDLTLAGGTLTLPVGTTTITGDLIKTGGTFSANGGTVDFGDGSQSITGAWTFANAVKTVSAAATLTLPASITQTFTGAITLQGASGQLLSLRSSTPDTQARIDPQGARTLSYLDVKDNYNANATVMNCGLTCVDSLNNTNWVFAPGITVGSISGNVNESGTTATFTVVLDTEPGANVTIDVTSSDTSEGTVDQSTLTFTAANWDDPQTVTVTGQDDAIEDGNIAYSIVLAAAESADGAYDGLDPSDVPVTTIDDDNAGITVGAISGNTTEAGGTANFTVVLDSQPTASVTIGVSSTDTTEGTVSTSTLTFTTGNWDTPQTVTVTGVNDFLDDGDIAYNVTLAAASSSDGLYNGINPDDRSLSNIDNDTAGITIGAISGNTTEAGGTATFTIVLNSQPTADVTIGITSDDTTEGTVSPSSVTFTSGNWSTPRTVTITGQDDFTVDGNIAYTIVLAAATSADGLYNGVNPNDVAVTNNDNDAIGFLVSGVSGHTTEAGGTATFTVRLTSQPSADVTTEVTSSDTTEGTVSPSSLTFTNSNWNTLQTVTLTGVDDVVADGDIVYSAVLAAATSADTDYNGINPNDVSVTNDDNDAIGFAITAITGDTTEAGGTATFTMRLTSQPSADVVVGVSSSDTTEGTVSPSSLTFTNSNWNTPQTVTVTGVNDVIDDGDIDYTVVLAAATSGDSNYNGQDPADVSVTNIDNETSTYSITGISGNTTEAGGTATFTVALTAQPSSDVSFAVSSSDITEGTVDVSSLTFTNLNWSTPQTVTITGVDDAINDGDVLYTIILGTATSGDANYNNTNPNDVGLFNVDNEDAGFTISGISGSTSEAGGTATFTVRLTSQPSADVTIGVSSSDTTEGTVSPSSLTFTNGDWNTPQTITVTGVDDVIDDGTIVFTTVLAPASSGDADYNGLNPADVFVSNTDDDIAGFTVSVISGNTTEAGGTATFTVVLNTQPTADVTVGVSSSDTTEGTVSPSSLTFTSVDWDEPQTVTLTGVNDAVDDGDIVYSAVLAAAVSADTPYNTLNPPDRSLSNVDNDTAGVTLTQSDDSTDVTEDGDTDTYTIVLTSEPIGNVTITIDTDDETSVNPTGVTFTAGNWATPQTVTVTALDDEDDEATIYTSTITHTASSIDSFYDEYNIINVVANVEDNDQTSGGGGGSIIHFVSQVEVHADAVACPTPGETTIYLTAANASDILIGRTVDLSDAEWAPFTPDDEIPPTVVGASTLYTMTLPWIVQSTSGETVYVRFRSGSMNVSSLYSVDLAGLSAQECNQETEEETPIEELINGISPWNGLMELITVVGEGDVVRAEHYPTIYLISGGERHPFPDEKTYFSHFSSFLDAMQITDATLPVLPAGTPVLPAPGSVLVKIASMPHVYWIEENPADVLQPTLRHIPDEETAIELFGEDWADYVIDMEPTYFSRFKVGDPLTDETVLNTSHLRTRESLREADSDGDGLPDSEEVTRGTDRTDADTDNDGYWDGLEVMTGNNPLSI